MRHAWVRNLKSGLVLPQFLHSMHRTTLHLESRSSSGVPVAIGYRCFWSDVIATAILANDPSMTPVFHLQP